MADESPYKQYMEAIGRNWQIARLRANKSASWIASQLELTPAFMSMIESGTRAPGPETLYKFAQLVGVAPYEILIVDPRDPKQRVIAAMSVEDVAAAQAAFKAWVDSVEGR